MKLDISQIFKKIEQAKNKEERIELLRKHNSLALRDLLRAAYDDTIQFIIPDPSVRFEGDLNAPEGMSYSSLLQQSRKLIYFVKGGKGDRLNPERLQKMYKDVLDSLDEPEAKILYHVVNKELKGKYKGLTKALVKDTWPRLILE